MLATQWELAVLMASVAQPCNLPVGERHWVVEWHEGEQSRWQLPPHPARASLPVNGEGQGL